MQGPATLELPLCGRCRINRTASPDSRHCAPCRERDRATERVRRAALRAAGLCYKCGDALAPGRPLCARCCATKLAWGRKTQQVRHAAGLCRKCAAPVSAGAGHCGECRAKNLKRAKAWERANAARGMCPCGGPPAQWQGGSCARCVEARWRRLGIDPAFTCEGFVRMAAAQGGGCLMPGCDVRVDEPNHGRRLVPDHDHATGRVRGLLCGFHNRTVGAIENLGPAMTWVLRYVGYQPS